MPDKLLYNSTDFVTLYERLSRMTNTQNVQLYNDQQIRTAWDSEEEKWYFSIIDVVKILTDSKDPSGYWRKLKQRLKEEGNETVTNCHGLKMLAPDGRMRLTDVADQEQLFRLIQSIPSPKAEPFKRWMAQVASERMDEVQDPELAIDRAMDYYRRKGYGEKWIEQRMQGKATRKALTDEWRRCGVKDNQFAMLTDILTKEWSGFTTKEYKRFKGLKKENLRDNMTNLETAVNTLAEAFTTELSKKHNPKNIEQNRKVAKTGGGVARETREKMEKQLGRSIVSSKNAKYLKPPDGNSDEIENQ